MKTFFVLFLVSVTALAAAPIGGNGVGEGDGTAITNIWIKTIIRGSYNSQASGNTIPAASRYLGIDESQGVHSTASLLSSTLAPIGGFLTNFQVWSGVSWPTTTNITFIVQTNKGLNATVSTPITCILNPGGNSANTYTNSGTTSLVLPLTQESIGYIWALNFNCVSSGGVLTGQKIEWTIDWYHKSP